eukprot:632951-Amphidinium_carterae.3
MNAEELKEWRAPPPSVVLGLSELSHSDCKTRPTYATGQSSEQYRRAEEQSVQNAKDRPLLARARKQEVTKDSGRERRHRHETVRLRSMTRMGSKSVADLTMLVKLDVEQVLLRTVTSRARA